MQRMGTLGTKYIVSEQQNRGKNALQTTIANTKSGNTVLAGYCKTSNISEYSEGKVRQRTCNNVHGGKMETQGRREVEERILEARGELSPYWLSVQTSWVLLGSFQSSSTLQNFWNLKQVQNTHTFSLQAPTFFTDHKHTKIIFLPPLYD